MPTIKDARNWYSQNDPVHGYDHIYRVYMLALRLAESEGADVEIVKAAVLLHDINEFHETELDAQQREEHHIASADFAEKILSTEGWSKKRIVAVKHCIRAHRFRSYAERPNTIEAKILFDADKLDAIGAIGVARAVAYAVRSGQPLFSEVSTKFLETGAKESEEPHSAYHEYVVKLSKLKRLLYTSEAKRIAEERHSFMKEFFERLLNELNGVC